MYAKPVCMMLAVSLLTVTMVARAQDQNLLPKYGPIPKSAQLKQADAVFITGMDQDYHGDRKKAASDIAARGWQYLQGGDPDGAMRRFNQAWLLDSRNGIALWGMAAVESDRNEVGESLKLFSEFEPLIGENLNFAIDYARAISVAGIARKDNALLGDAYSRFQAIYHKAPQNIRNLQNWAKTLYADGKYSDAWAKVTLAEATPDKNRLDPKFIAALQAAMPRPQN